jgi:heme exporter protein A
VEAHVALRAVTKTFGPVRALLGVSARFSAGRVTVVVGPNGSGKSTLLAIVGALAKPTSGKVDHASLGSNRTEVRAALGWVGHESLSYGDLSGRENLHLAARLYGIDPARAFAEASDRFELASFADRPVRTYSRGQRQRIAVARALVHKPMLLLLDEPTTGLDTSSTARLVDVVTAENARGAIVVVVTHDESFARDVLAKSKGDRLEMERGRVVGANAAE